MFQHGNNIILSPREWQIDLVYFGDIDRLLSSRQKDIAFFRTVHSLSRQTEDLISLEKLFFFTDSISNFLHIITLSGLQKGSHTIQSNSWLQNPMDASELKWVLSDCDMCQQFVSDFASIAALLKKHLGEQKLLV